MGGKNLEETQELASPYTGTFHSGDAVAIDTGQLPPGTRVGDYLIEHQIALGGGGAVYAAQAVGARAGTGRVAIKVLLTELTSSTQALARFQREAEVVKLIDHPHIAAVLDSGELPDGRPYIVMELVSPENLRSILHRRGRFSPAGALEILEPVCWALSAAHAAGVIHRDLKASNISVGREGGRPVIKLLDFGIAKLTFADPAQPGLTVEGSRLGTPYAMAPEQIRGDAVDERADIYSLGVLTFQLLTATHPFAAASRQEIERLHLETPAPRASRFGPVSPALDAVILRCMEKAPEGRYGSVREFLAALQAAVAAAQGLPTAADAGTAQRAVALYVEVQGPEDCEVDVDALMDDSSAVMDLADHTLLDAGFQLALETSNAVLGARLLPDDPDAERAVRQSALAVARALLTRLAARAGAHPMLSVTVCLHAAEALVDGPLESPVIAGGAIVNVPEWPAGHELDGLRATTDVLAGL